MLVLLSSQFHLISALSKPPLPSLPPKTKAVVTFDYDAVEPDELSLKEGETIDVVKQEDGGWWEGICRGKTGVFPSNFVEIVKDSTQKDVNSLPDLPPKEPKASPPEGELMSFDEKQIEEQLSSSPPQRPPPVEEGRPKTSSHQESTLHQYRFSFFMATSLVSSFSCPL